MRGTGGNQFIPANATAAELVEQIDAQIAHLVAYAARTGRRFDPGAVTIKTGRIDDGRVSVTIEADFTPAPTAVEGLVTKWSGCWCGPQLDYDHDPRVRDCPQHGDDSSRHMAEGITLDLRAILAAHPAPGGGA